MAWNSPPLNKKFPLIQPHLWSRSYLQSLRQVLKGAVGGVWKEEKNSAV